MILSSSKIPDLLVELPPDIVELMDLTILQHPLQIKMDAYDTQLRLWMKKDPERARAMLKRIIGTPFGEVPMVRVNVLSTLCLMSHASCT